METEKEKTKCKLLRGSFINQNYLCHRIEFGIYFRVSIYNNEIKDSILYLEDIYNIRKNLRKNGFDIFRISTDEIYGIKLDLKEQINYNVPLKRNRD